MVTYAKRPAQSARLTQDAQKPPSQATAPATGLTMAGGVAIETTFDPLGATIPDIRLNRAEQSSGEGGKSSNRQAPSKTSAADASGKLCIEPSVMSSPGHTVAQSPVGASSTVETMVNIPRSRLSAFSRFNQPAQFNWWPILTILATIALWAGIVWIAAWGVSAIADVTL